MKQRQSACQNSTDSMQHSGNFIWPFRPSLPLWSHVLKTSSKSKFLAHTVAVPLCEVLAEGDRGRKQIKSWVSAKKKLAIWLGHLVDTDSSPALANPLLWPAGLDRQIIRPLRKTQRPPGMSRPRKRSHLLTQSPPLPLSCLPSRPLFPPERALNIVRVTNQDNEHETRRGRSTA